MRRYRARKGDALNARSRELYAMDAEKNRAYQRAWHAAHKDRKKARSARWYAKNQEHSRAKSLAWKRANPGRYEENTKKWRKANSERMRESARKWTRANASKRVEDSARQRALRLKRIPKWTDRTLMRAMYAVSGAWRQAGFDVHVDHVVPLQGKRVSGLHVIQNLTILPAMLNRRKSNALWERT